MYRQAVCEDSMILNQVKPAAQARVRLPADLLSEAWLDSVLVLLRGIKHTQTYTHLLRLCMYFCLRKQPLPNADTLELLRCPCPFPSAVSYHNGFEAGQQSV